MKIVDRQTFLALPEGTLFCKYATGEVGVGTLLIKGETCTDTGGKAIDFMYQDIADAWPKDCDHTGDLVDAYEEMKQGKDRPLDFDCQGRDGLFEQDQLFAVWSADDVKALIYRLEQAKVDAFYGVGTSGVA